MAIHKFIVLNKQLARTRRAGTLAILARLAVCAGVETGTAVVVVGPQAHTSPGGRVFATQVKACRRPGVFPFRRVTADRRTYTVKCRFKSTPALHSGTSYPPCTGTWSRRSGRRWPLHSGRLGRSRRSEQHWWLCPHKCLHSPRCLQRMEASHTRRSAAAAVLIASCICAAAVPTVISACGACQPVDGYARRNHTSSKHTDTERSFPHGRIAPCPRMLKQHVLLSG